MKGKAEAQNWSRVALSIAHKTGRRVGFDTATRMAADANFAGSSEATAWPPHAPVPALDPLDELVRIVSEDTRRGYHSVSWRRKRPAPQGICFEAGGGVAAGS